MTLFLPCNVPGRDRTAALRIKRPKHHGLALAPHSGGKRTDRHREAHKRTEGATVFATVEARRAAVAALFPALAAALAAKHGGQA